MQTSFRAFDPLAEGVSHSPGLSASRAAVVQSPAASEGVEINQPVTYRRHSGILQPRDTVNPRPRGGIVFGAGIARVSRLRPRRLGLLLALLAVSCAHTPPDPSLYIPSILPTADPSARISSPFGTRTDPITGRQQFHAGIDIAAERKSEVVATAHGRVVNRGRDRGGYGKFIEVDHGNGYTTRYAHLARIKANTGKNVKRGDRLGRVGKTGRATGPHVHYEVRLNGKPIDPKPFLPGAP